MSGARNSKDQASTGANSGRKRAATNQTLNADHNDTADFQQVTLNTLRQIQRDIATSKNETMESQQQLADQVQKRVEQLEDASALQALATENDANKALIKQLQGQLEAENRKQEEQDQVMEEMRKEMIQLKNRGECSNTTNVTVRTMTGQEILLRMRPRDVIYMIKLKIRELEGIPLDNQRLVSQGHQLEDDKTLADYGIVFGSVVYVVLAFRE